MAYSLLGIFGLSMPMLYGEGRKTFAKLQEEIVKVSTNHSLFSYAYPQDVEFLQVYARSIFVRTFAEYRGAGTVRQSQGEGQEQGHAFAVCDENRVRHYSTTNLGLKMELPVLRTSFPTDFIFAKLDCCDKPRVKEQEQMTQRSPPRNGSLYLGYRGSLPRNERRYPGPFELRRTSSGSSFSSRSLLCETTQSLYLATPAV